MRVVLVCRLRLEEYAVPELQQPGASGSDDHGRHWRKCERDAMIDEGWALRRSGDGSKKGFLANFENRKVTRHSGIIGGAASMLKQRCLAKSWPPGGGLGVKL